MTRLFYTFFISLLLIQTTSSHFSYKVETRHLSQEIKASFKDFPLKLRKALTNADQPEGYCTTYNPIFPLNNMDICGED